MFPWKSIENAITATTGITCKNSVQSSLGGGCINSTYKLRCGEQCYFVKINTDDFGEMFAAEADGLKELAGSQTIKVPKVVHFGREAGYAWLVLELLNLGGHGDMAQFGVQLAQMHQHQSSQFGWFRDNTIGSTHQPNGYQGSWPEFLRQNRFAYQLDLAKRNGCQSHLFEQGQVLLENIDHFFKGYSPKPSLLHGDLWSGNYAFTRDGEAVIFDPAVYYGDREADIAMTELFGAFGQRFYQGYESVLPLDSGYKVRKTLYNLYHIINHFNLFGGGYQSQAMTMIDRLLSELK